MERQADRIRDNDLIKQRYIERHTHTHTKDRNINRETLRQ